MGNKSRSRQILPGTQTRWVSLAAKRFSVRATRIA